MNIEVRIRRLVENGSPMIALLSVTLDGKMAIHDIKLIQRTDGSRFVAMPSRRDENGVYRDVAHPIGTESRRELEASAIKAYEDYLASTAIDSDLPY